MPGSFVDVRRCVCGDGTVHTCRDEIGRLHCALQVPFAACLERFAGAEVVDDVLSAATGRRGRATKRIRLSSMPPYLVVALKRYYVDSGWVPKKMEVSVEVRGHAGCRVQDEGCRVRGAG